MPLCHLAHLAEAGQAETGCPFEPHVNACPRQMLCANLVDTRRTPVHLWACRMRRQGRLEHETPLSLMSTPA